MSSGTGGSGTGTTSAEGNLNYLRRKTVITTKFFVLIIRLRYEPPRVGSS